jgi:hypothetical protein
VREAGAHRGALPRFVAGDDPHGAVAELAEHVDAASVLPSSTTMIRGRAAALDRPHAPQDLGDRVALLSTGTTIDSFLNSGVASRASRLRPPR